MHSMNIIKENCINKDVSVQVMRANGGVEV
jgi:hypothetical protein